MFLGLCDRFFLTCILIHCSEIFPWIKDVAIWCTILASASKWGPFRGAEAMNFYRKVSWPSVVGSEFSITTYDSGTPLNPNIVDSILSNPVIHLFHFQLSFNLPGDTSLLTELASFASCFQMADLCATTTKAALKDASSRSSMLGVSLTLAKSLHPMYHWLQALGILQTKYQSVIHGSAIPV